tara:strand:- start:1762 stop:2088 length:327 start_codon:yes stop_codon:yes gene_type:complete
MSNNKKAASSLTVLEFKLIELVAQSNFSQEAAPGDWWQAMLSLEDIAESLMVSTESARGVLGSLVKKGFAGTEAQDHAPEFPEWFWVYVYTDGQEAMCGQTLSKAKGT